MKTYWICRGRVLVATAVAVVMVAVGGCGALDRSEPPLTPVNVGEGEDSSPITPPIGSDETVASMAGIRNAVIALRCPEKIVGTVRPLSIMALDLDTADVVREYPINLPDDISLAFDCRHKRGTAGLSGGALAVRQLFDEEFERMAIAVRGTGIRSGRVGYFDIRTRETVDLRPPSTDSFAVEHRDGNAIFHPGRDGIWFVGLGQASEGSTVYSISIAGGEPRHRDTLGVYSSGRLLMSAELDDTPYIDTGDLLSPNVERYVTTGFDEKGAVWSIRLLADQSVLASTNSRAGEPAFWLDNDRLLLLSEKPTGNNFIIIEIEAGSPKAKERMVLPENDRLNLTPVPTPNRDALYFLSRRGGSTIMYRVGVDGSGMTEVGPVAEDLVLVDVRT
jgi:hypothetical protein